MLIESVALAASLSVDALSAGFVYGSKRISIPVLSMWVISGVCCVVMGVAMFFGAALKPFLPQSAAVYIAFAVLLVMGLVKLLDGIIKTLINRRALDKEIKFCLFDIQFILHLYANPEAADVDTSAHLSAKEALVLAVPLSLDGFAVGFAAALAGINPWALLGWCLAANFAAIFAGEKLGYGLAEKLPFNISWVGGVVLIALAFMRLF